MTPWITKPVPFNIGQGAAAGGAPASTLTDGLKLYYTFGASSSTQPNTASEVGSTDAIANSDVTLYGDTTHSETGHVAGVNAIGFPTFDLHGNYATSSNPASDYDFLVTNSADTIWTICFWLQTACHGVGCGGNQDFWGLNANGAGNDLMLRYLTNSQFTMWFAGNEENFTLEMTDTDWHFYRLSWDEPAGIAKMQLDNGAIQTKTGITTTNTSSPNDPIYFGDTSGSEFEGNMQLFSVWNRILEVSELDELWNEGAGKAL